MLIHNKERVEHGEGFGKNAIPAGGQGGARRCSGTASQVKVPVRVPVGFKLATDGIFCN